jgi:hypothetical protein
MAGALGVPCWSLLLKGDWVALGTDRHPFHPDDAAVLARSGYEDVGQRSIERVGDALQRDVIR